MTKRIGEAVFMVIHGLKHGFMAGCVGIVCMGLQKVTVGYSEFYYNGWLALESLASRVQKREHRCP